MPKTNQWPTERERPLVLCHFSKDELQGMDDLQGGPSFDRYGIREYSKLGKIIKIPEIQELFIKTMDYATKSNGRMPPEIESAFQQIKPQEPPYQPSPTEDQHPQIKELREKGTEGDTDIAWVPEDFVEFLISLRREPKVNPHTGLLMFGFGDFFKGAVRVAGAIGGALLGGAMGGPLGAMAGSGLGSLGTRYLTGQSGNKAFSGALGDAGKTSLFSALGGAFHSMFPGVGQTIGGYLPQGISNAAHSFFSGPNSLWGGVQALMAGPKGSNLPLPMQTPEKMAQMAKAASATQASQAGQGASQGILGGLGSLLSSPMAMMPLAAGIYYNAKQQEHKHNLRANKEAWDRFNHQKENDGFNKPWTSLPPLERRKNPEFWNASEAERQHGIYANPYLDEPKGHFAHGGHAYINHDQIQSNHEGALIKGPGKGQDDSISTTVPPNSYILDATTVSAFGDGSSDAGAHILKQFENQIKARRRHAQGGSISSPRGPQLPVYLSNDEYILKEPEVTTIGGGDNNRGAKILKQMVLELRKDKSKNGIGLAPKAKDPLHYMDRAVKNIMKGRKDA